MAEQNKYEIISLEDFETRIKCGNRYQGLVDRIGYVYWESRPIYFIDINQGKQFKQPIYQQINNPWFGFDKSKTVHTRTLYTLCVLSRKDLMKQNKDMYLFYYGHMIEIEKALRFMPADATRVEKPLILADIQRKQSYETSTSAGRKVWNIFDGTTDIVGDFGFIPKPVNKYLSIGKTVINVIDNVGNEKYLDAAGNVLMSFIDCSIGVYIDVGVSIYKTDLMQRRIAHSATKEYFNLQNRLNNLVYGSSEYNRIREKMKIQEDIIRQCADNIGIKYNVSIKPQWKQGH